MTVVTGKDIWEAIKQDADFMASVFQYEGPAEVLRDYVENTLLTAIGDMVDKPVTISNIIDAKITYFKHALQTGMISRLIKATPKEAFGFFDFSDMLEMKEGLLAQLVEELESIAKDAPIFLKENGVSDESFYKQIGLNPENVFKAMSGGLTIGGILISQPAVILQMSE